MYGLTKVQLFIASYVPSTYQLLVNLSLTPNLKMAYRKDIVSSRNS